MRKLTKYTALTCILPVLLMLAEGFGTFWVIRYPETLSLNDIGVMCLSVTLLSGVVMVIAGLIALLSGKTNDERMRYGVAFNFLVTIVTMGISFLMWYFGAKTAFFIMIPVLILTFMLAENLMYARSRREQIVLIMFNPLLTWMIFLTVGTFTNWSWMMAK
ncbi:MAG: hypothetical protein K5695_04990 [Oscillospiraceae bacterium]|nr:hypothetical protein [Oscillospiraceae bacterium]